MTQASSSFIRRLGKGLLAILGLVLLAFLGLVIFLAITEYRPADQEEVATTGQASDTLKTQAPLHLLTWNIGYGALGDNASFFMDGGEDVYTADAKRVQTNLQGIQDTLSDLQPDILFLQEVDRASDRSYHTDQAQLIEDLFPAHQASFAYNFKVKYVPFPLPPIGRVASGVQTLSRYPMSEATRVQLPIPHPWPISMANLKRCLLVNRIPTDNGKELVLINLHLEAYDDGEGRLAQTAMMKSIMDEEVARGNYVIAGGDFNQSFSHLDLSAYPQQAGLWQPGLLDSSEFDHYQALMDPTTPTCRSTDQVLAGADRANFQYYVIDGFLVSENIKVHSLETVDLAFRDSDHNPVQLQVQLQ